MGCHFLLQGIFPTQGWNLCLLCWQQILYHWATREALLLSNFLIHNRVLLPMITMLYITSPVLVYNWKFISFHHLHLEKEMATHSSVLAWRIPKTGVLGGLPSMGLHRVRHDWSHLAAASLSSIFPPPHHLPLTTTKLFSVFLDSTWKWDYTVFLLLCVTLFLSIMPSKFIYLVTKDRISFFLWLCNIPLYICMCIYKNHSYIHTHTHYVFFIHWSIDGCLSCFCMLGIVKKKLL